MVSGANGDSFTIKHRAEIMRVDRVKVERQDTCLVPRRADQLHAIDRRNLFGGVRKQIFFIGADCFQAHLVHVA